MSVLAEAILSLIEVLIEVISSPFKKDDKNE